MDPSWDGGVLQLIFFGHYYPEHMDESWVAECSNNFGVTLTSDLVFVSLAKHGRHVEVMTTALASGCHTWFRINNF